MDTEGNIRDWTGKSTTQDDQAKRREAIHDILDKYTYEDQKAYSPSLRDDLEVALDTYLAAERERVEIEARLDERNRVTYEHESFSKEWLKDRIHELNLKQWWLDTAVDAHNRRIAELQRRKEGLVK